MQRNHLNQKLNGLNNPSERKTSKPVSHLTTINSIKNSKTLLFPAQEKISKCTLYALVFCTEKERKCFIIISSMLGFKSPNICPILEREIILFLQFIRQIWLISLSRL